MVVWLRNSLIILLVMSETEKALSTQTKEILGETVVLGEGFYDDDDPIEEEKGSWSSYVTEKLVGAKEKIEKFKEYVEDFKTKLVGEPELETMYVPELKVTPLQKNPVFPTEDVKIEKVEKPVEEDIETPIIPKEKPSDNELLYSKLFSTNYFKALRDKESKVVDGKIATEEQRNNAVGDDGASLGSYQIQRNFFKESMEWLKRNNMFKDLHNKSYEDIVKDPNQATKIIFGYYMRYAPNLVKNLKFEQLARLHNGGPGALKSDKGIRLTNDYADEFNKILESYNSQ